MIEVKKGYYETGEPRYEFPYKDGERHGIFKIYNKDGSIHSHCYWWHDIEVTTQVELMVEDIFHISNEEMIIMGLVL